MTFYDIDQGPSSMGIEEVAPVAIFDFDSWVLLYRDFAYLLLFIICGVSSVFQIELLPATIRGLE